MKNLESSVTKQGKYVTQIIHFKGGYRKTIRHIDTDSIEQGQFTKFFTKEGRMILIHDPNVLMVEVFQENNDVKEFDYRNESEILEEPLK